MKKFLVFTLICMLSGLLSIACERQRGVQAGREETEQGRNETQQGRNETYPPRPAPKGEVTPGQTGAQAQEMKGELTRVDWNNKTIAIRAENGMEQTFKFNDQTMVMGLENQPTRNQGKTEKQSTNTNQVRALMGKEGSEVTVNWRDENGAKMATTINVTDVGTKNSKTKTKNKTKSTY